MSFTYQEVQDDALVLLKDAAQATYDDDLMAMLVNDAVQIVRKVVARQCPSMIWSTKAINLVDANAGPYEISSDFESPLFLLDEYGKNVGESYRGEFSVSDRSGKPDGYWIEGYAPANLYVNSTPAQAYAWTLYYIATVARKAVGDFDDNMALPDFLREPLVQWVKRFAADSQEYDVTDEDGKIRIMTDLVGDIMVSRRPKMEINISGVGF